MKNVPFRTNAQLEEIADNYRSEFWKDRYPVSASRIWELRMCKDLNPEPGLRKEFGIEALLNLGGTAIYVDQDCFDSASLVRRMNFSIAHEIGHFALHMDMLKSINIRNPSQWKLWLSATSDFALTRMEKQADIFAACLLMPREEVVQQAILLHQAILNNGSYQKDQADFSIEDYRIYFANQLGAQFEVSGLSMRYRLKELGVFGAKATDFEVE